MTGDNTDAFIATFRGDDRFVMDYLMEEVFRRQAPDVQRFLLQTSILDRLCAPLCAALAGCQVAETGSSATALETPGTAPIQELLEHLERANLFLTPLDHRREWYRFHALFADLLRYRACCEIPEQLPHLHRQACRWFREHGDGDQAMQHARAISDDLLAADLAEEYMLGLIGSSRTATYLRWIERLPDDLVRSHAVLCVGAGWVHVLFTRQPAAADAYAAAGEAALARYQPVHDRSSARRLSPEEVRGHLTAVRAHSARLQGDFPRALALSVQALQELPLAASGVRCVLLLNLALLHMGNGELPAARTACLEAVDAALAPGGNFNVALNALATLAGICVWQGKLGEASQYCARALQVGGQGPGKTAPDPAVGAAHGWLLAVHLQRNDLVAAGHELEQAIACTERIGAHENLVYAYLFRVRLAILARDFPLAERELQRVEELMRARPVAEQSRTEWIVNRGLLLLARSEIAAGAGWLAAQGIAPDDVPLAHAATAGEMRPLRTRLPAYLLLARVLLAQGERSQATMLLERLAAVAEAMQNVEILIDTLVLQAVAEGEGLPRNAGSPPHLERALRLAAPEGYVRPFLDAGEALVPLLQQAIRQGVEPGYAHKLLTDLAGQQRVQALGAVRSGERSSVALAEPLTEREEQILRLLAAGLSSPEIAAELVLSVSTVRSYIKTLYAKLDAHGREEALDKGRQLGVL
jgi:LuxR family maltose regulon positive regulatory protein